MPQSGKCPFQRVDEDLLPNTGSDGEDPTEGISWQDTQGSPPPPAVQNAAGAADIGPAPPSPELGSPVIRRSQRLSPYRQLARLPFSRWARRSLPRQKGLEGKESPVIHSSRAKRQRGSHRSCVTGEEREDTLSPVIGKKVREVSVSPVVGSSSGPRSALKKTERLLQAVSQSSSPILAGSPVIERRGKQRRRCHGNGATTSEPTGKVKRDGKVGHRGPVQETCYDVGPELPSPEVCSRKTRQPNKTKPHSHRQDAPLAQLAPAFGLEAIPAGGSVAGLGLTVARASASVESVPRDSGALTAESVPNLRSAAEERRKRGGRPGTVRELFPSEEPPGEDELGGRRRKRRPSPSKGACEAAGSGPAVIRSVFRKRAEWASVTSLDNLSRKPTNLRLDKPLDIGSAQLSASGSGYCVIHERDEVDIEDVPSQEAELLSQPAPGPESSRRVSVEDVHDPPCVEPVTAAFSRRHGDAISTPSLYPNHPGARDEPSADSSHSRGAFDQQKNITCASPPPAGSRDAREAPSAGSSPWRGRTARSGPEVCEDLRRGLRHRQQQLPVVSSQERRSWLGRVAGRGRPQLDTVQGGPASEWLRRIRVPQTPEKDELGCGDTSHHQLPPPSAKKGPPKRGGLVLKLRRLLKRSQAFARMSHLRRDGAADQAVLRLAVRHCERQLGAHMVLARTADGTGVQVVLSAGAGHPTVAAGDTLLLHPPWQRLQPPRGPPVLLPIGGTSAEPGSPPAAAAGRVLYFTCPCPADAPLPRECVRPLPRPPLPSELRPLQSHLSTVREATLPTDSQDDTTILGALGCGGEVVRTIDATVLHICQYRCPADSQPSEGAEVGWCWSLLVGDSAGCIAELMLPPRVYQRHRQLCRRGGQLRLHGLVVRQRTTSDLCPGLASMVSALSGSSPGFTYVLQALDGDTRILAGPPADRPTPARPVSGGCGDQPTSPASALTPGQSTAASSCEPLFTTQPSGAGDLGSSAGLDSSSRGAGAVPAGSDGADSAAGRGRASANQNNHTAGDWDQCGVAEPDGRTSLVCSVLALLADSVLVLTSSGDVEKLELTEDTGALLSPAVTVELSWVWRCSGRLVVDRYTTVKRRSEPAAVTPPPPPPLPPPLTTETQERRLVSLTGQIVGADEQCASIWPTCSACGSDDLTETSSGQFCNYCLRDSPSVAMKMELKVELACPDVPGGWHVTARLLQPTIETLLGATDGDEHQEFEVSSVVGEVLRDMQCVVTEKRHCRISLHEVRLWHSL